MHLVLILAVGFLACNFLFGMWTRRHKGIIRRPFRGRPTLTVAAVFAVCVLGAIGLSRLPFEITVIPPDPSLMWMPTKTLNGFLDVGAVVSGLILLYLVVKQASRLAFRVAGWLQERTH